MKIRNTETCGGKGVDRDKYNKDKTYHVVIHFAGCFSYDIKAENKEKAESTAWDRYDLESAQDVVDSICDADVCDCYEVREE